MRLVAPHQKGSEIAALLQISVPSEPPCETLSWMNAFSVREKIALALTLPAALAFISSFLTLLAVELGIPTLGGLAAIMGVTFGAISFLSPFVSAIYLLVNLRRIRLWVQTLCWIVNLAWSTCWLLALLHQR